MNFQKLEQTFSKVRSNRIFELFVIGIIIFSALVVGVKTYDIPPSVSQAVVVLDWLITFIFLIEITIGFLGEENKRHFFKSGWNVFDTLIVLVSIVPIDNSEMAVVGRLVRIFRVLRMVSIIPELRVLLNSLIKALPQLGYVMLLMFIIFYIYGAVGSMLFAEKLLVEPEKRPLRQTGVMGPFDVLANVILLTSKDNAGRVDARVGAAVEAELERRGFDQRAAVPLVNAAMGSRIRNSAYRRDAGVSLQVASLELRKLSEAGLLVAHGEKRGRSYVASPDLLSITDPLTEAGPIEDPFDKPERATRLVKQNGE